jgi:hypothetical protein
MNLKCTACGVVAENETDIRFCREITNKNGDPCGSIMLPIAEKREAKRPARKDGE